LTLIYAAASDFREQTVYSILRTHQDNEEERNAFRSRLQCLVPIFRGLIEAQQAREDMRHHYYAQLAYVYKDQPIQSNNPTKNWDNALENLDAAIEQRKKLYLDNLKFGIYEFNRLVCKININVITASTKYSHEELMKDFNTVYNDAGIRYMLFGTSEYIAPNLLKWIEGNPETKVNYKEWLDERENRNSSTTS